MNAVIEVEHLRKTYGPTVAVDDVSFQVTEGEIFGLLGPNGAGKTTTVECLQGLRRPDLGEVRVLGLDPQSDGEARHRAAAGPVARLRLEHHRVPHRGWDCRSGGGNNVAFLPVGVALTSRTAAGLAITSPAG